MADNYYPTDCDEQQELYTCENCDEQTEHGRVRHVALVRKKYLPTILADPTNPQVWKDGLAYGDVIIIPDVIGTWNGGEPKEGTGYGDQEGGIDGFNHEINFKDKRLKSNSNFYKTLAKSKDRVAVWALESLIFISTKTVSIAPKTPVTENLSDIVNWEVKIKCFEPDILIPHERSDEIFTCAFITA